MPGMQIYQQMRTEKLAIAAMLARIILTTHSGVYPMPIFTGIPPRLELPELCRI